MREMLLDRAQDTIIQIKILRDLERNLLSSIKMPSTCIVRYLSVKEQSMHLLWETGLLPPWVRQSVLTKLISLSNLQLIDLYYSWTLMLSNIQSTWLSNWSLIKGQGYTIAWNKDCNDLKDLLLWDWYIKLDINLTVISKLKIAYEREYSRIPRISHYQRW